MQSNSCLVPYDDHRPPTSTERETIYHAFRRVLETCYPSCRYIQSPTSGNIFIKFSSEITVVDEDGNEDDGDRLAALYGGRDSGEHDLHLLVDLAKWRALSSEHKIALLVHEATHIDGIDHGDAFWNTFIENIRDFLEENPSSEFLPEYDQRELIIAAIHHVNPHSCDGDWSYYDRREWVANQLSYPNDDYEKFERLAHEVDDSVEFCEQTEVYEAIIDADSRPPCIVFLPRRGEEFTNMTLAPEFIEDQSFDDSVIEFVLERMKSVGYPPLHPPVVEPKPCGEYRLIEGVDEVAIAQRVGLFEIGVINRGREVENVEDRMQDVENIDLKDIEDELGIEFE